MKFASIFLTAAALWSAPAQARESDPVVAVDGDDVVVQATRALTATKTDTPIAETPQAISVIPADLFRDRNAVNLQETLRYTAGVAAESYGTDMVADSVFVRGFSPAYMLDGMQRNLSYTGIPRIEPFLLERVELLRGPASILYGQGGSGGIVNALTKRPLFHAAGEAGVQYGTWDRKQVQADITGPLDAAGTIAGRLVALYRDAGQQTDFLRDDRLLVAPSLTWRPGADTSITLLATFQRDLNGSSQQFLPVAATRLAGGPGLPVERFLGEPDFDRQRTRQGTVTAFVEQRITTDLTFRSATRYAQSDVSFDEIYPDVYSNPADPFIDPARRLVARTYYSLRSRQDTVTSDNILQWDVDTGPVHHRLVAGVDYLRFHEQRARDRGDTAPIDVYAPVYGARPAVSRANDPDTRQDQLGLYVQDQIGWRDVATLVLGARRDRAVARLADADDEISSATTFRAGLIVNVTRGVAPYVSYTESFQPVAGLNAYNERFRPQRGHQWEAGIKWQPAPAATLTAAAFEVQETNRPATDPLNPINTVQTGRARSRGVEFEAGYTLPDDITVTAAYAHVDATVLESSYAPEVGAQFGEVPKDVASGWIMKAFRDAHGRRLRLGTGVRYVGPVVSTGDGFSIRTPGYTLVDAQAEIAIDRWIVSVRASNLLDRVFFSACRVYGDCFTGNRRNVVASLGYRF